MSVVADVREFVMQRAAGLCERCGQPGQPKGGWKHLLQIHHKKRRTDGGDDSPKNLEALCHDCHTATHRPDRAVNWGRPKIPRKVKTVCFRETDLARLKALSKHLEMNETVVIRTAIRKLAESEGVE